MKQSISIAFALLSALPWVAAACSERYEPCEEFEVWCVRTADAKLELDTGTVRDGGQVVGDASKSVYDKIKWFLDGAGVGRCENEAECAFPFSGAEQHGKHTIRIQVKVEGTGSLYQSATAGAIKNSTKDETSATVTVHE